MNFVNLISRNKFLVQLYPMGILTEVRIGQFSLDVGERSSLNIHTRQQPVIEVKKWGKWNKDFNRVVIKLLGSRTKEVFASDWSMIDYHDLLMNREGGVIYLKQKSELWEFNVALEGLVFQSCEVYLEDEDDPSL